MFYLLSFWMAAWMGLATASIWLFSRDRYPFSFLLFLSNIIQLLYLPLLQIKAVHDSRDHRATHQEILNQHATAHSEVTHLLAMLHEKVDKKGN